MMVQDDETEEVSEEVWIRRAAARQRQIDIGKARPEYEWYQQHVPPEKRAGNHPKTPDPKARISKRAFDRQLSNWRRRLHDFDLHVDGAPQALDKELSSCEGFSPLKGHPQSLLAASALGPCATADCFRAGPTTDRSPATESTRADSEEFSPVGSVSQHRVSC